MTETIKYKFRSGNGEMLSFAMIAFFICWLIIILTGFIQGVVFLEDLSHAATAASRVVAMCSTEDDAQEQAETIADYVLNENNSPYSKIKVEIDPVDKNWQSGSIVMVTVSGYLDSTSPFSEGTRSKTVAVTIEGLSGTVIEVPDSLKQSGLGATDVFENYPTAMSTGANQGKVLRLWKAAGSTYEKDTNLCTYQGYYMVAMTTKFGTVGDKLAIELKNGEVIYAILADSKGSGNASVGTNEWGHLKSAGKTSLVELEIYGNKSSFHCPSEWNGVEVARVINMGSIL